MSQEGENQSNNGGRMMGGSENVGQNDGGMNSDPMGQVMNTSTASAVATSTPNVTNQSRTFTLNTSTSQSPNKMAIPRQGGSVQKKPKQKIQPKIMMQVIQRQQNPHREIQIFWPRQLRQIERMDIAAVRDTMRNSILPYARIKKIMRIDDDVRQMMISAEVPAMIAKACEIFIEELTLLAWAHTDDNKRKTLQRSDIALAISKNEQFDFLIDIVPREEVIKPPPHHTRNKYQPFDYSAYAAGNAGLLDDDVPYVIMNTNQLITNNNGDEQEEEQLDETGGVEMTDEHMQQQMGDEYQANDQQQQPQMMMQSNGMQMGNVPSTSHN